MTSENITFEQLREDLLNLDGTVTIYAEMRHPISGCSVGVEFCPDQIDRNVTDRIIFRGLEQVIRVARCEDITKYWDEKTTSYELIYDDPDAFKVTIWVHR